MDTSTALSLTAAIEGANEVSAELEAWARERVHAFCASVRARAFEAAAADVARALPQRLRAELIADTTSRVRAAEGGEHGRLEWLLFATPGTASAMTPTSLREREAHDAARRRLVELLGRGLGATPRTVGLSHVPIPLRMARLGALLAAQEGGPAAHVPSSESVAAARCRVGAPGGGSGGGRPGSAAFALAPRWERVPQQPLLASRTRPQQVLAPRSSNAIVGACGGGGVTGVGVHGCGGDVCSSNVSACSGSAPLARATVAPPIEATLASGDEDDDCAWSDVELGCSKEAEEEGGASRGEAGRGAVPSAAAAAVADSVFASQPPIGLPPDQEDRSLAAWAAREAARLKALGTRRALAKAMHGDRGSVGAGAADSQVLRNWRPDKLTALAPLPGRPPSERHANAAARMQLRSSARASRAAAAGSVAPAESAAFLDPAPHGVLPLGPLALPHGTVPSHAPKLLRAKARRAFRALVTEARLRRAMVEEDAEASRGRSSGLGVGVVAWRPAAQAEALAAAAATGRRIRDRRKARRAASVNRIRRPRSCSG